MTAPHVVQPPPQTDPQTSAAAQILTTYATIEGAVLALQTLLAPAIVGQVALLAAIRIASRQTKHQPRNTGSGPLADRAARAELYYRAAYVLRAAQRIQADLDRGLTLRAAVIREGRYYRQHEAARKQRMGAVTRDQRNMSLFGQTLGWYLNPLLNNEAECIAANGNNYDGVTGTVIGRPGAVHSGCGCTSGPPWASGGWVDDAVAPHIVLLKPRQVIRKRKKAA